MSEVNTTYYDFVASSRILMSKIKVVLKCEYVFSDQDSEMLKNSSRLYQGLEIKCHHEDLKRRINSSVSIDDHHLIRASVSNFVLVSNYDWKYVRVSNTYFGSQSQVWEFLSAIESTVETLCLDVEVYEFIESIPNFDVQTCKVLKFRMLKKLKLLLGYSIASVTLFKVFSNCRNVQKLEIRDCLDDRSPNDAALKMIQKFDKLKGLKLYTSNLNNLCNSEIWKEFRFNLKSFKIVWCNVRNSFGINQEAQSNIMSLLEDQAESIEKVTWNSSMSLDCFNIIEKLPKLRSFNLQNCPYQHLNQTRTWRAFCPIFEAWKSMYSTFGFSSTVQLKFTGTTPCISVVKREKFVFPQYQRFVTFSVDKSKLCEIALE